METRQGSCPALSILIVEDEILTHMPLRLFISSKFPGAVINFAENGKKALELFREHLPELVITDMIMPEMNGIQMTRTMKSIKADTQFIVLTGSSDHNLVETFSELGVIDYIVKPVEFEKLFLAIQKGMAGNPLGRQATM